MADDEKFLGVKKETLWKIAGVGLIAVGLLALF